MAGGGDLVPPVPLTGLKVYFNTYTTAGRRNVSIYVINHTFL